MAAIYKLNPPVFWIPNGLFEPLVIPIIPSKLA
jgi:hypothetical protein